MCDLRLGNDLAGCILLCSEARTPVQVFCVSVPDPFQSTMLLMPFASFYVLFPVASELLNHMSFSPIGCGLSFCFTDH